MSKRSKYTTTDKYHCILPVLKGEVSTLQAAKTNRVSVSTIQSWVYKYKINGLEGLKESKISNRYSESLKYAAVQDL